MRVSPTPVREALERLVGEGLVVPTGAKAGFQVVRLSVSGLIQVLDVHSLLAVAAFGRLQGRQPAAPPTPLDREPVVATEAVFGMVFWERVNAQLAVTADRMTGLLATYRLHEPAVLPDWHAELSALTEALSGGGGGAAALRSYHRRRTSHAAELISACEEGEARTTNIRSI